MSFEGAMASLVLPRVTFDGRFRGGQIEAWYASIRIDWAEASGLIPCGAPSRELALLGRSMVDVATIGHRDDEP